MLANELNCCCHVMLQRSEVEVVNSASARCLLHLQVAHKLKLLAMSRFFRATGQSSVSNSTETCGIRVRKLLRGVNKDSELIGDDVLRQSKVVGE